MHLQSAALEESTPQGFLRACLRSGRFHTSSPLAYLNALGGTSLPESFVFPCPPAPKQKKTRKLQGKCPLRALGLCERGAGCSGGRRCKRATTAENHELQGTAEDRLHNAEVDARHASAKPKPGLRLFGKTTPAGLAFALDRALATDPSEKAPVRPKRRKTSFLSFLEKKELLHKPTKELSAAWTAEVACGTDLLRECLKEAAEIQV